MRAILSLAILTVSASVVAQDSPRVDPARYALRDLHVDSSKYALRPIEVKNFEPAKPKEVDPIETADRLAVIEEATLASNDGKNPVQQDFEFALKKHFGADVDVHAKMAALKVGPYAESELKVIHGDPEAAREWRKGLRWIAAYEKLHPQRPAPKPRVVARPWNAGGVKKGVLPPPSAYESSQSWNQRNQQQR